MSQVVIVTGGAGGIGSSICTGLVSDGHNVVIADFDGTAAERLSNDLGSGSLAVQVDVSNKKSVEDMISEVRSRFGNIDVLLNGAGIMSRHQFDLGRNQECNRAGIFP